MAYYKRYRSLSRPMPRKRGLFGLLGMGDFSDATQCSEIPLGDPYRKPGNYCATPDGGTTTFNADGTTYRAPGYAVDPDPAHPVGTGPGGSATSSGGSGGGILDAITRALTASVVPQPTVMVPGPSTGMSTTTMVALAGGAVLLAVLLSRR